MRDAVIVDAVRTPLGRGKPGGGLAGVHPVDLHAHMLRALVERTGVDPAEIDDVISGAVGQAGEQSANTARWAALAAGFPESVPGVTVDRQCGSSQQALSFAAQGVVAGAYDVVVASGVESMSTMPIGSQTLGRDPRGPEVAARYPEGLLPQGVSAELIAARYGLSRQQLDDFSLTSGAIAIGHPLGASGARLATTLLSVLEQTGGRYGLQTMCEAGGTANATVIERLDA
jgi:acetyl-CoA acyltransferase